MVPLITSFGLLRPWRERDAEALARHANNRKIWRNLRDGFPSPYTLEDAWLFIRLAMGQNPMGFYAIATQDEVIGGIGVSPGLDVHRLTAEMGYWLAESYWGKGIMSESVRRFSDFAFDHFRLVRIYAEPYAENAASVRVLVKAGFVLEGRLRCNAIKEGRIRDQLLYARLREG